MGPPALTVPGFTVTERQKVREEMGGQATGLGCERSIKVSINTVGFGNAYEFEVLNFPRDKG